MNALFDIYVSNFLQSKNAEDFELRLAQAGASQLFIDNILRLGEGFLGLNLSRSSAQRVHRDLQGSSPIDVKIRARKYRDIKSISYKTAFEIADAKIKKKKIELPHSQEEWIGETFLFKEADDYWSFALASPTLVAKGAAPGVLLCHVDKIDGHIWSTGEVEYYDFLNNEDNILRYAKKTGLALPFSDDITDDRYALIHPSSSEYGAIGGKKSTGPSTLP